VECARSRETAKRSQLGDAADYGYCVSHSRFFWGFRLHAIFAPHPPRYQRTHPAALPQTRRLHHPQPPARPTQPRTRRLRRLSAWNQPSRLRTRSVI
jgi:hypothetical protein